MQYTEHIAVPRMQYALDFQRFLVSLHIYSFLHLIANWICALCSYLTNDLLSCILLISSVWGLIY
jgi:hypothetical protein